MADPPALPWRNVGLADLILAVGKKTPKSLPTAFFGSNPKSSVAVSGFSWRNNVILCFTDVGKRLSLFNDCVRRSSLPFNRSVFLVLHDPALCALQFSAGGKTGDELSRCNSAKRTLDGRKMHYRSTP